MISVAMTTYNGEKYIKKQLDSILSQTVPVDEIIICDDCSTDKTREIIQQYNNSKIKLICNDTNLGYVENFYQAIGFTKGDYIFLADQDDVWEEDKVEKMLQIMKSRKCFALCSNFQLIDENDKIIDDRSIFQMDPFLSKVKNKLTRISFSRLIFGNIVQGCTYCFTQDVKECYLRIHNKTVVHDYQIMLIASLLGDVYFLNDSLISYRIHALNSIGFEKNERKLILKKEMPSKKPFMVQFLDDVDSVIKVRWKIFYKVLYYGRIPYLRAVFRKLILGH